MSATQRQLDQLLKLVDAQQERECAEIMEHAREQARQVRRQAHAEVRGRMRQVVIEERAKVAEALAATRARHATELRQRRLEVTMNLLHRGRHLLHQQLRHRWREPASRAAWIASLVREAAKRLPYGLWVVTHPRGWDPAEMTPWFQLIQERSRGTLCFQPDAAIPAGLRICREGTCLDGTIQGLMARQEEINVMLLAFLEDGEPL